MLLISNRKNRSGLLIPYQADRHEFAQPRALDVGRARNQAGCLRKRRSRTRSAVFTRGCRGNGAHGKRLSGRGQIGVGRAYRESIPGMPGEVRQSDRRFDVLREKPSQPLRQRLRHPMQRLERVLDALARRLDREIEAVARSKGIVQRLRLLGAKPAMVSTRPCTEPADFSSAACSSAVSVS